MAILPASAGTRPDEWGYGYEILPAGTDMKFYPRVEYG